MSKSKEAAFDEVVEQKLSQITAEQFLDMLNAKGVSLSALALFPEKKKVEYWPEPENLGEVKLGDLFDRLRAEKKKIELEADPGSGVNWGQPIWNPVVEKKKVEMEVPDWEANSKNFEGMLNSLADRIAARIKE